MTNHESSPIYNQPPNVRGKGVVRRALGKLSGERSDPWVSDEAEVESRKTRPDMTGMVVIPRTEVLPMPPSEPFDMDAFEVTFRRSLKDPDPVAKYIREKRAKEQAKKLEGNNG